MAFLTNVTLIIIFSILYIAQRVFLCLAVYFDCKSKNISSGVLWTVLTVFFGWIPALVYVCLRKTLKKKELLCRACGSRIVSADGRCPRCGNDVESSKIKQYNKTSIAFLVLFIVFYILSSVTLVTFYTNQILKDANGSDILSAFENGAETDDNDLDDESDSYGSETVYYDRNGAAYSDIDDVVYYDAEGNTYLFNEDEFCFVDSNGASYSSMQCFIDEDGYFYYDTDNKLEFDSALKKYTDKDGKTYVPTVGVYWDAQGNVKTIYG